MKVKNQISLGVLLNSGAIMPRIGLGTWESKAEDVEKAISYAIDAGYRMFDTAAAYGNEEGVGRGLRKAIEDKKITREEIFVTTKLWNSDQGYYSTIHAFEQSLSRLSLDYVDLYLIHWPLPPNAGDPSFRKSTWKALEEIQQTGKARSIGVSNYTVDQLQEMEKYATTPPAVNQYEVHPFFIDSELNEYCKKHTIAITAYSPLARGKKLYNERITAIAKRYGVSNAQLLIRWNLQCGNIVIPKSITKERIEENINVWNFEISEKDMNTLNNLNEDCRIASPWNPHDAPAEINL